MELEERYRGALLGLAIGDAVGTAVEFSPPGTFTPVTDMTGGGPFGLPPGAWTDDTSMTLCLAASLIARQRFDPGDQMDRYVRWWQEGYLSSTGTCFDIGNTVREALTRYRQTGDPYSGATHERAAGNGSLMRLAPIPLAYARVPAQAIHLAGESSRTTHGAPAAVDACRYFAALLVGALQGEPKDTLLGDHYHPAGGWASPLAPPIAAIAAGSFKHRQPPEIRGSGYVVHSLEAALWAFYQSDSYRAGCLLAVNLGEDADTTGAIYGQLAGAYYGTAGLPAEWQARLIQQELIADMAGQLHALAARGLADMAPEN